MDQLVVVSGAALRCSAGAMPSRLMVGTNLFKIQGQPACSVNDFMPMSNVFPFGVCGITNQPCIPKVMSCWETGAFKTNMSKSSAQCSVVAADGYLKCSVGGVIQIVDPGQHTVKIKTTPINVPAVLKTIRYWTPDWMPGPPGSSPGSDIVDAAMEQATLVARTSPNQTTVANAGLVIAAGIAAKTVGTVANMLYDTHTDDPNSLLNMNIPARALNNAFPPPPPTPPSSSPPSTQPGPPPASQPTPPPPPANSSPNAPAQCSNVD